MTFILIMCYLNSCIPHYTRSQTQKKREKKSRVPTLDQRTITSTIAPGSRAASVQTVLIKSEEKVKSSKEKERKSNVFEIQIATTITVAAPEEKGQSTRTTHHMGHVVSRHPRYHTRYLEEIDPTLFVVAMSSDRLPQTAPF